MTASSPHDPQASASDAPTGDFSAHLARYAELLVRTGVNLPAGGKLRIAAPVEAAPQRRRDHVGSVLSPAATAKPNSGFHRAGPRDCGWFWPRIVVVWVR